MIKITWPIITKIGIDLAFSSQKAFIFSIFHLKQHYFLTVNYTLFNNICKFIQHYDIYITERVLLLYIFDKGTHSAVSIYGTDISNVYQTCQLTILFRFYNENTFDIFLT